MKNTPEMESHHYQSALAAVRDGSVLVADESDLRNWLLAIAQNSTGDDAVQARDMIQAQTINHLLLKKHTDALDRKNGGLQKLVVLLTIASLIGTGVQVWYGAKAERRVDAEVRAKIVMQPLPQALSEARVVADSTSGARLIDSAAKPLQRAGQKGTGGASGVGKVKP